MNNVLFKKRTFVAMPFCLEIYADGSATTIFIRSRGVGVDITLKLEQQKSSSRRSAGGRLIQCVQQQKQSRAVVISAAEQLRPAKAEGANKCRTVETSEGRGCFIQCVQQQKQSRAVAISAAEQLRSAQLRPEGANKCRTVETSTVETSTVETSTVETSRVETSEGGGRFIQCVQQQKQSREVAISAAEELRPAKAEGANKCRTVETRTVETSTVETSEGGGGRFS